MSFYNFPPNPNIDDTWLVGVRLYKWNGTAWTIVPSASVNVSSITATNVTILQTLTATNITVETIAVTSATNSNATNTGALTVVGGVGIGGNLYVGGEIVAQKLTIEYTTVTTTYVVTDDIITTANTTTSDSTETGALVVAGGVGIGGNLNVGGSIYSQGHLVITDVNIGEFGVSLISAGTDTAVSTSTGQITIWNTSNLQTITNRSSTTTNAISITNETVAESTETGALKVVGGIGVGGNAYIGGDLNVGGSLVITTASIAAYAPKTTIIAGTDTAISTSTGEISIWNISTLQSVSDRYATTTNKISILNTESSTATVFDNALYVAGGVGIGASLFVTGPTRFLDNVLFEGSTTYLYTTNTIYTDNLIELHAPIGGGQWAFDDGKDIGIKFHYYRDGTDTNAALVLSQETRYLEWYSDGVEGVDKFDGAKYGSFKLSEIILTSTQTSTSEITGALQVAGGVGVGGNLYVGGSGGIRTGKVEAISGYLDLQSYWDGSNNGQVRIIADDVDNNYGQITVSGAGIEFYTGTTSTDHSLTFGIDGTTTFSGKIIVQSTESSISTTTGALQVAGGVGIAENLNVGNSVYVNNAVNWLNSSTNVVAVYQVYNPDTQSLDTIFA